MRTVADIYDKNGLPIRQGDIVKMFHFIGARGKRHYMYKQAGETVILGKAKPEPFMRFSHLDLTDAYFVEILDDRKRDDFEIVQGVEAFWEDRHKRPNSKPGGSTHG